MTKYTYEVPELIATHVIPDMINHSVMTDKQLIEATFNYDDLNLSLEFKNQLSVGDEAILSGMMVDDLVHDSWVRIRRDELNDVTDNIILNDFVYDDVHFKLDVQHEISYLATFVMSNYIPYPYTIKGIGSEYVTLTSQGHFVDFIGNAFGFMEGHINYGWTLKDSLTGLTVEQLKAYEDPRL